MTPAQREALIEQVGRDRIVWAGLVGEIEGKYAVNMFLSDGAAGQMTVRAAGVEVHILHDGIENCGWLATEGKFQGLLTLPGADGNLVGPDAATIVADRINATITDPPALRASVVKYARFITGMSQRMNGSPVAFMALRARALAGYVNQNNRLPTQAEFEHFVGQRGEPWAIALRSPRHNRNMLNAETLQLQQIPEPQGRFANPYPNPQILANWLRPGLPLLGTAPQVATRKVRAAARQVEAVGQVEVRRPLRIEDLPPGRTEYAEIQKRFYLPKADDKTKDVADHRYQFHGLGA